VQHSTNLFNPVRHLHSLLCNPSPSVYFSASESDSTRVAHDHLGLRVGLSGFLLPEVVSLSLDFVHTYRTCNTRHSDDTDIHSCGEGMTCKSDMCAAATLHERRSPRTERRVRATIARQISILCTSHCWLHQYRCLCLFRKSRHLRLLQKTFKTTSITSLQYTVKNERPEMRTGNVEIRVVVSHTPGML
jgi:hypothetical protein